MTTTTTPLRPDAMESIVSAHEARRLYLMHEVGELADAMPSMIVAYRPTGDAVGVVVATDGGVVPGAALGAAKGAGTPLGTGTAAQVKEAFHTSIHKYVLNSGEEHWSNASDPSIPTSLMPAV